jgi:hypothetical protein
MPGRSKKEERERRLEEEGVPRKLRERAERQVTFSVWDRNPIKQYVRRFGWLEVIQGFVERRLEAGVDRPLRYLTIPGPNASDIRFLWQAGLLYRDTNGFPYVVICDRDNADEALKVLGAVRGVSRQSFDEAMRYELHGYFPFDVINVDICGAVITGDTERRRALRTLAGIRRAFWLQRGQGFLLLLTTSTDDISARKYLEDTLLQNFHEDNFQRTYLDRYGALDFSPFQEDYRALVSLVLPKAIGKMARARGYRVIERFAAKYNSVGGHHMLCHSFELEPLGAIKPAKKYETCFKNIFWDELNEELSNRVLRQATDAYEDFLPTLIRRDPQDIANILRAAPDLEAELRREAESLIRWWESDKLQGADNEIC